MTTESVFDEFALEELRRNNPEMMSSPGQQSVEENSRIARDSPENARNNDSVGGNPELYPTVTIGRNTERANQSDSNESLTDYQDLETIDETYGNETRDSAAPRTNVAPRSKLEDILRDVTRESGGNTEAMLVRLLARTLANEQPQKEVPLYHVIPDLSKNIENFSGDGKGTRPKDWIENIESMQKIHNWPENFALETARMHLRGGARDWYRARTASLVTWEAFKRAFCKTFVVAESTSDRWQKMVDRVQQKDESLSAYFHAKTKLCNDLKLDFRDIKEQVLDGLWSKELCISLMARFHDSLDELLHDILANDRMLAQRASRSRGNRDPVKPKLLTNLPSKSVSANKNEKQETSLSVRKPFNTDRRPPVVNAEGQPKCYNCSSFGHIARDCPEEKRELVCKRCKKTGHTQRHCNENRPSTNAEVNVISELNNNSVNKYVKTVQFNGRPVVAFIDTGSSDCTIKATKVLLEGYDVVPIQTGLKPFGPPNYKVVSPGIVRAEISVDGVTASNVPVRIVPDDTQGYDVLIGRTFTELDHIEFQKSGDKLTFKQRKASYLSEIEPSTREESTVNVVVSNDITVAPATIQFIDVVCDTNHHEMAVINADTGEQTLRKGRNIERGVMTTLPRIHQVKQREPITPQDLDIGEEQPQEVVNELVTIMNDYRDCVATNLFELGRAKNITMDIKEIPGSKPVESKPYRASNSERDEITRIIREWREANIVRDTDSPYASPVLLVRKKSGESRLVVDFRRLNRQTERVHFPLPNLDDHLSLIKNSKLFITLDLAHGYLQIPLSEEAKPKTAIITPDETVEFNRMIFGLMNGPAYFSKAMQRALGPLRDRVVLYYLDDIFIPGRDWEDLKERLILTLEALRKAGLTIKLSKCKFLQNRVTYLGFEISSEGIEPGEVKIKGIIEFPTPKNPHEIRRFIGMASFFRRFIPKFAQIAAPLHALLKSESKFMWGENEKNAFEKLKEILSSKPILQTFDPERKTELHTDASALGLAAMLFQRDDQKRLRLVYAISRRTSQPEKNYHSSKLELLAIIWAVTRLRPMLINIHFTIVTDCQALLYLSTQKTVNPQIVRWNNMLNEFDYNITHRPGTKLVHVDALSRAPVGVNDQIEQDETNECGVFMLTNECDEIAINQSCDEIIKRKCAILKKPASDRNKHEISEINEYELVNGIVYKRQNDRLLFVVPRAMRKGLAVRFHDLKGHPGLDRTIAMLAEHYYFPGVRRYLRQHIVSCIQCALTKVKTGKQGGSLHPIPPGERPFAVIHVDHTGPFVTSKKKNKFIFAIIDNLTKFVILTAVKDTKVSGVIKALEKLVNDYGAPRKIISDRGTCFTSARFAEFCSEHGIHHSLNSPRHPQANGQIERVNFTLIPVLQTSLRDTEGRDWDTRLPEVQRNLNDAPNSTTGKSAFEMLYGYRARRNEGELRKLTDESTSYIPPNERQQAARKKIEKEQQKTKQRYDKNRAKNVKFKVGDVVFMRVAPIGTGESTKLQKKYRGPLVVTREIHEDTYKVADLRQEEPGRRYASTAHTSQLKIWRPQRDDETSDDSTSDDEKSLEHGNPSEETIQSHESEDEETSVILEKQHDDEEIENQGKQKEDQQTRRSKRHRRVPAHLQDFETTLLEDE